jgi:hypothetical protein
MSLYPDGHPPFTLRGVLAEEEMTGDGIQSILTHDLQDCLNASYLDLMMSRHHLEQLRVRLFRAEQLLNKEPLPVKDAFVYLPHDMAALLETIKSTQKCLEEWFESEACKRILEKYPTRPMNPVVSSPRT